jgi:hypothetical protein
VWEACREPTQLELKVDEGWGVLTTLCSFGAIEELRTENSRIEKERTEERRIEVESGSKYIVSKELTTQDSLYRRY